MRRDASFSAPAIALCLLALLAGCGPRAKTATEYTGPVFQRKSDAGVRESVAITVYNQNFGLVREIRPVELGKGRVALTFGDVSAKVQPETVQLRGLDSPDGLLVLEQNYRFDLLTPEKLLEKNVGKVVRVYRWNEALGREESFDAEVLSTQGGAVLKIGNEVTSNVGGRLAFPGVPANLIEKPTLVWLVASDAVRQRVEVTYLTQGLNWRADYVLSIDAEDKTGDLNGWVTLTNDTGTSYERANLKLVAGDVQRVVEAGRDMMEMATAAAPAAGGGFREESFFEYHLYDLDRKTTLLDKEQKQVALLEAHAVALSKKLRLMGGGEIYRYMNPSPSPNLKVGVYVDLVNSKGSGLGMPLPKGTLRVYKADSSGARQFVGESAIDHTPRDEEIKVKLGESFDVVAERKQTSFKAQGTCSSESAWSIDLRNHKESAERVEVYEPASGDWQILEESVKHVKKDAHTFVFDVAVPAQNHVILTYRIRTRWC